MSYTVTYTTGPQERTTPVRDFGSEVYSDPDAALARARQLMVDEGMDYVTIYQGDQVWLDWHGLRRHFNLPPQPN